jgi:hypothetical protein
MAADALTQFQSPVTKIAAFDGAAQTFMPTGTPDRGMQLRIIYSAASTSAGAGSAIWGVKASEDGGSTWNTIAQTEPLVLGTTAVAGELYLKFAHRPGHYQTNPVQYRASLLSISGTNATVTYQVDTVSTAHP